MRVVPQAIGTIRVHADPCARAAQLRAAQRLLADLRETESAPRTVRPEIDIAEVVEMAGM